MLGFISQACQISSNYFQRDTISKLDINKSSTVIPPAIHICSRFGDIDYDADHLTPRQLLQATPTGSKVLTGCQLRIPGSYLKFSLNTSAECLQHMTAIKYTRQRQTCYRFGLHHNYLTQLYRHSANSLVDRGLMFEIRLDWSVFRKATYFDIEFAGHTFPPLTFPVPVRVYPDGATGLDPKTFFQSSYTYYTTRMLPPPYQSNCIFYGDRGDETNSKEHCIEKCRVQRMMQLLDQVPFTTYIADNVVGLQSKRILSATGLHNATVADLLKQIEEGCVTKRECRFNNCFDVLIVTQPMSHRRTGGLQFEVHTPKEPYYETYIYPRLVLLDYAIYLASAMGFWLGYAVMDTANVIFAIRNNIRSKPQKPLASNWFK
ncbi:hypothetical protein HDE_03883 [Halotydeus destructor]|nr:hypothetical protein HDE_03883 [Halotydeus destructor]